MLGVFATAAGWRLLSERLAGLKARQRPRRGAVSVETEVMMSGQLAFQLGAEVTVVPAVVWETLPVERQVQVTLRLARLLAALVEAGRDE